MKKLLNVFLWSAAVCTLGLFSCTEKDLVEQVPIEEEPEYAMKVDYDAIKPTDFLTVPAKDGYITVVKQDGRTLMTTTTTTTMEVLNSRNSLSTRSGGTAGVDFSYLPDDGSWNDADKNSGYMMYKTIMWEDRITATDHDYNDLIIHVQQYKSGSKLRIYIHPIALGSHDELSLGADIFLIDGITKLGEKCASIMFSDNVRELFRNQKLGYDVPDKTFVNTYEKDTYNGNGKLMEYPTYFVPPVEGGFTSVAANAKWDKGSQWIEVDASSIEGKTFGINWFIINNERGNGKKLYAVPAIKDNLPWRDNLGFPYGIISADTRQKTWPISDGDYAGHDWINYARENEYIGDVYTDFDKWLTGDKNADWDDPDQEKSINAIGYIRGTLDLAVGSKALYDMEGCFRSLGYSNDEINLWGNGRPNHSKMPLPDGRTW